MNSKPISELIHDRAFAEGATVVVWLDCAKFRTIAVAEGMERIRPRTMYVRSEIGDADFSGIVSVPGYLQDSVASSKFNPSSELLTIMKRNADEVQSYLDRMVRAWRSEVRREDASPASGPSCQTTEPSRTRDSKNVCDCHAGLRSEISAKTAKSGARAVLAAIAVSSLVFGSALAPIGEVEVRPDADEVGASAFSLDFSEICAARAQFAELGAPYKGKR